MWTTFWTFLPLPFFKDHFNLIRLMNPFSIHVVYGLPLKSSNAAARRWKEIVHKCPFLHSNLFWPRRRKMTPNNRPGWHCEFTHGTYTRSSAPIHLVWPELFLKFLKFITHLWINNGGGGGGGGTWYIVSCQRNFWEWKNVIKEP